MKVNPNAQKISVAESKQQVMKQLKEVANGMEEQSSIPTIASPTKVHRKLLNRIKDSLPKSFVF